MGFRGEAHEQPVAFAGCDGAQDVGGRAEFEGELGLAFLQFARGDFCRCPVGDSRGHDEAVGPLERRQHLLEHFGGCEDVTDGDSGRWRDADRAGNEAHLVAARLRSGGEGVAHLAGRSVADEADGINGFASGAGGDEDAKGGGFGVTRKGWRSVLCFLCILFQGDWIIVPAG